MLTSVSSFWFHSNEIEKSFIGSGPKENFGVMEVKNVLAISTHSLILEEVCLITAVAKV